VNGTSTDPCVAEPKLSRAEPALSSIVAVAVDAEPLATTASFVAGS
jgi:hypothetical protein